MAWLSDNEDPGLHSNNKHPDQDNWTNVKICDDFHESEANFK